MSPMTQPTMTTERKTMTMFWNKSKFRDQNTTYSSMEKAQQMPATRVATMGMNGGLSPAFMATDYSSRNYISLSCLLKSACARCVGTCMHVQPTQSLAFPKVPFLQGQCVFEIFPIAHLLDPQELRHATSYFFFGDPDFSFEQAQNGVQLF
jgi:hypothetical protein